MSSVPATRRSSSISLLMEKKHPNSLTIELLVGLDGIKEIMQRQGIARYRKITAQDYYYRSHNVTRTTLSGVAAYRSALTLDWLAAEDHRQRELVMAFGVQSPTPARVFSHDCGAYDKPASGKVARLLLEMLKNLEGDDGVIIADLIQALVRGKLLVETSLLDVEPDLDALMKTPDVMLGEPHATFPRILAMVWMAATDATTTKRHGWCPITKVTKYITVSRRDYIAQKMETLDLIVARARFIMEEFIQHVTPINVYDHSNIGYRNKQKSVSPTFRPTRTTRVMAPGLRDYTPSEMKPSPPVQSNSELNSLGLVRGDQVLVENEAERDGGAENGAEGVWNSLFFITVFVLCF